MTFIQKLHEGFNSYLRNRKQYIQTDFLSVTCAVPEGIILGPLLSLPYVNDLINISNIADSIMFADDTNLFFSNCNIPVLLATVNIELSKINHWWLLAICQSKIINFFSMS